ncbi:hypothetical protein PAHAL_3G165900 [Panicum hallii]|jgi:hypothetical protein|uniref:DUF4408 domain-containing protein n=1 Tax=Panicum hallii TaxID=206008 RepID=A0A2T8KIE7_9POAL|nr:predicted GPI-anchored protein 58 [Panicum hallii]PVH61963.1 hypothetical protein PAHAL_3G165900 [Panicum hallii]
MAAAGAALRLRLLYRMLRVGELLALVAFLSWSSSRVPSAAAAVLRLAGSLLLNARFVFVLGNAIVLLLVALSRHDLSVSSNQQTSTASATAANPPPPQAAPAASASFPSFATPAPTPSGTFLEEAASFATPAVPAPAAMEAPEAAAAPAAPETARAGTAFEDQPSVRASRLARAPRRSRSEKMGPRLARRAVSPELRRSESENGRRRRSSVTARDAQACWGMDDADEFRRTVEAFIAKQTRFHREESLTMAGAGAHCGADQAFACALAVVE